MANEPAWSGEVTFSHINAGRWDEKLEGGIKSSALRMFQVKTVGNLISAGAKLQLRLL